MGMTQTATATRTVEARIWKVRPADQGGRVELWLGQREGNKQFHTRVPLSAADTTTWFQVTLEDDVIVGVTV